MVTAPTLSLESKPQRLIRLRDVKARTGLGRSTIYAYAAAGKFPQPIPLGTPHAVAWIEAEIDAWITATIHAARPGGIAGGIAAGDHGATDRNALTAHSIG